MKNIFLILLVILSVQSYGQQGWFFSGRLKGDTLYMYSNTGDSTQVNKCPRVWGQLQGSISNQTDLQTALDAKQPTLVSGTNIKTVNGSTILGSGDLVVSGGSSPTFINLANDFSSTSTTPAVVTGWNFAVTSGKTYKIEVIAGYQTAATTTGGAIAVSVSGGAAGTIRGDARGSVSASAAASELSIPIRTLAGAGSTLTTTGVSSINTPHFISLTVTFTCTGSGTFNILWGTEVAGSAAQLNANSSLIYQALN